MSTQANSFEEPRFSVPEAPSREHSRPCPPHWLEVVSHLHPKYGGLSAAVPALSAAVAAASGNLVTLAAFCAEGERIVPAEAGVIDIQHLPLGRRQFRQDITAGERFRSLVANAAAVHIHGLWQHSTAHAARLARELRIPYVVSAHGMLDRWALGQKRWKKAVYAALVERPLLRRAACLHALTEAEADDYRRFRLRCPVAVIPNGVTVKADVDAELFLSRFPALREQRLFLFLGRLHVKKGVHVLCEAWSDVEAHWPDAHLVIAGPDFENTRAALEGRCASLGCRRVTFAGMLQGDLKWSALRASDVFVLPSYSEGLSVSVLEAMGMGLPVIVTRQCNVPEVRIRDCGWEIDPDRDALGSAIEECLGAPATRLAAMGGNGRELVESHFSWSRVGRQMAAVYGWIAGGSKPNGVFAGERDEAVWDTARKGVSA
jgi:glycosyltransferase involved in cell wall biosynthesis